MTKIIQNSISLAPTFILPMWFGCMYYIIGFGMFIQSPWNFSLKVKYEPFSLLFKKMIILAHPISLFECYFKIDFYSKFHINHVFQNSTFNFNKLEKKLWFFSPNKWDFFCYWTRNLTNLINCFEKNVIFFILQNIGKRTPKKKKKKKNLALDMIKVYKCIFNIFHVGFVTQIYKF
jgi:predicted MPP superfamily phosphohydrolase